MTRRIGLYSPKPKLTQEQIDYLEEVNPRPQIDTQRELGQVAIIKGVLNVKHTSDTNGLSNWYYNLIILFVTKREVTKQFVKQGVQSPARIV